MSYMNPDNHMINLQDSFNFHGHNNTILPNQDNNNTTNMRNNGMNLNYPTNTFSTNNSSMLHDRNSRMSSPHIQDPQTTSIASNNPLFNSVQTPVNHTPFSPSNDAEYWKKMDIFFDRKLAQFSKKFEQSITSNIKETLTDPLAKHIELLETSNKLKDEKIETLTSIVANQQRSLSKLDSAERERNIIMSGLPEGTHEFDGISLNEDSDKFKAILEIIGVPSNANYEMNRIGKLNDRTKRLLKVDVTTKEHRDDILKKAKILKDQSESWSYVYLEH